MVAKYLSIHGNTSRMAQSRPPLRLHRWPFELLIMETPFDNNAPLLALAWMAGLLGQSASGFARAQMDIRRAGVSYNKSGCDDRGAPMKQAGSLDPCVDPNGESNKWKLETEKSLECRGKSQLVGFPVAVSKGSAHRSELGSAAHFPGPSWSVVYSHGNAYDLRWVVNYLRSFRDLHGVENTPSAGVWILAAQTSQKIYCMSEEDAGGCLLFIRTTSARAPRKF